MSRWFRFYADAMRHPKVARLSDAQFRLWVDLLAVAAERDGLIPPLDDLKHVLKRRLDHLSRGVEDLISGSLITPLEHGYQPHSWEERQYKSDTSTERVRKYRAKGNVSETAPDTESESETETEAEGRGCFTPSTLDARDDELPSGDVVECLGTTDLVDLGDLYGMTQRFARAGGVSIVDPKRISDAVDLVKAWTAEEGATPDVIEKAIAQALADATSPIRSLRYFDSAVRNAIARRRNGVRRRPSGPRSGWVKYDDE
jgi:hypothetical protein